MKAEQRQGGTEQNKPGEVVEQNRAKAERGAEQNKVGGREE
jgi:hypothetical protein